MREVGSGGDTTEDMDPSETSAPPPRLDQIDRFIVEELIGAGGMGIVYRAFDPLLDRRVAVKLLRSGSDLLAHEAKALARLSHPNVCAVYDVGTHLSQLFIAMEYIDGEHLGAWLARPHEPRAVVELFMQAGRGLEAAHAAGVVHADFKPSNVLVGKDGRVRVVDFGLARRGTEAPPPGSSSSSGPLSTLGGTTAGTPRYMAPEQLRGQRPTEKSDQFSFCVTLWEALHGELPYRGEVDHWQPLGPAGRRLPARVRNAMRRGLELDPERRWPSMGALLAVLSPRSSRRRALLIAGALVAAGLALGFVARGRTAEDRCAFIAARADEAWGPSRRATVKRAFLAGGAAFAEGTFGATARMLDDYIEAWRAEAEDACHTAMDPALPRVSCLEQRLADLRGLATALETPSPDLVRHAPDVAAALADLAACRAAAGLELPVPQAAELRVQVISLVARIDTWGALALHGAPPSGGDRIEELVTAADALAYPPLSAQAALVQGTAFMRAEEYDRAEATLTTALTRAEEGRAIGLQAEAWKNLCNIFGRTHRFAESHAAARHAEALLRSFGPEADGRRADLDAKEGLIFALENKPREARALLERALAAMRRLGGPESWREASIESSLTWHLWMNMGRLAEAEMHGRHAIAIYKARGSTPIGAADTLDNLGCLAALQGRPLEALVSFEEALAIKGRLLPPDVASVAETEFNYGLTLYRLRRFADAEKAVAHAHAVLVGKLHRDDVVAIENEALLGISMALGGRPAEARPHLEHALALDEKTPALDGQERAMARFSLALSLGDRALAEQARAGLAAEAHAAPEDLKLVADFLKGK